MTATILDPGSLFDDMVPLNANTVELSDASVARSTQLAQTQLAQTQLAQAQSENGWKTFLKGMAIAGFEQWLEEGATPLIMTHTAVDLGRAAELTVGRYRLCILAVGGLSDDRVELWLDSADSLESAIAHLYVIVEVQEEIDQVSIVAGLRRDQLLQRIGIERLQQARTSAEPLEVPVSHFEIEPEQILLYLNCLEPVEAIEQTPLASAAIRERGIAAAGNLVNTAIWLRDQLDSAIEQLRWELLPPVSMAMRPVRGTVDAVLETLASQGVNLPETARGVGGPVSIGSGVCQVYAWVWPVETETEPEWTLLLLLGPQIGEILPAGIQLRVSDRTEVLATEVLAQASSEAYLYTQVQGNQQEQFRVSVVLPDGMEITLPVFTFDPEI